MKFIEEFKMKKKNNPSIKATKNDWYRRLFWIN
jgi:hypothetical protein